MDNPDFKGKKSFIFQGKISLARRWTTPLFAVDKLVEDLCVCGKAKKLSFCRRGEKMNRKRLSTKVINNVEKVVNNQGAKVEKKGMQIREIERIFQEEINGEKRADLERFRAMLLEYNGRYNLTAITEEKEVTYKHFLDSAAGVDLFKAGAKIAEIGSGAGFPSMVLKILRRDLRFDLFESVGKKCDFLRAVAEEFGFEGVRIFNVRAEDAAKDGAFREQYDYATARAVARMNTLTEYCLPFVKVGGRFIAYKSGDKTEIEEAKTAYKTLGGALREVYEYALPEGFGDRVLAVVEKVKPTPNKYPRGQGKERKQPL